MDIRWLGTRNDPWIRPPFYNVLTHVHTEICTEVPWPVYLAALLYCSPETFLPFSFFISSPRPFLLPPGKEDTRPMLLCSWQATKVDVWPLKKYLAVVKNLGLDFSHHLRNNRRVKNIFFEKEGDFGSFVWREEKRFFVFEMVRGWGFKVELTEQNNLFIMFHRYFIDPRGLKRTCNFFNSEHG